MSISSARPLICLITPGSVTKDNFEDSRRAYRELAVRAVEAGIDLFQIREKQISTRSLFDLVTDAVSAANRSGMKIMVNDRLDVALAAGADGVHLPGNAFSPAVVRRIAGDAVIVGVSAHDISELTAARDEGADYAFFSPVFETPGKGAAVGIDGLRSACDAVSGFPVLALGGITEEKLPVVSSTGAAGVAAIRLFNDSDDLTRLVREIRRDVYER